MNTRHMSPIGDILKSSEPQGEFQPKFAAKKKSYPEYFDQFRTNF